MPASPNQSLQKIAKGAGIAFIVSLIGLIFALVGRVLVARIGTEAEYGIFSLAFVILNICGIIGTLGLKEGATRSIAHARGQNNIQKVQNLVSASIQFGLLAGILLSLVVFFTSDVIAIKIFHDPNLSSPIKIFALGIPLLALLSVLGSIFRGFDNVKPQILFGKILRHLIFPFFLLPLIFFDLSFTWVFYAFVLSLAIPCGAFIIYSAKKIPTIRFNSVFKEKFLAKELFFFSLPLLGVAMLQQVINWTDTLMLGGFRVSSEVGLYNAAHPLARFISTPLQTMLLIYMPIASGLYAQGNIPEIRRNFSVLTKWLCSATLPLFFILFLFPDIVLGFLFGKGYIPAANALRILSLGFIINNFLGPNGATLIAMGETRFIMWATFATAVLNIGLNASLIPPLGIIGAAVASVTAITSINLIRCWKVYSLSKAQPLSKNLIKSALISLVLVFLLYFVFKNFVTITFWMLLLFFILYYGIYGLIVLFTKSFDQEDIAMILAIEKKMGINAILIKRVLKKFL